MSEFKPKKQKLCLSDCNSEHWELSAYVNREIWRNIPFREQDEIMKMINSLQSSLESACANSYEKLSFNFEVKNNGEYNAIESEQQPKTGESEKKRG